MASHKQNSLFMYLQIHVKEGVLKGIIYIIRFKGYEKNHFLFYAVSNRGKNSFPTYQLSGCKLSEIFGSTWEQVQPFKVKPK